MRKLDVSVAKLVFIAATRAALGAGAGLLAAQRLRRRKRRRVAFALLALGALTTIPAAFMVFGGADAARKKTTIAAA